MSGDPSFNQGPDATAADRVKKEEERTDRKQWADSVIELYKKLIDAKEPEDVFGEFYAVSKADKKKEIARMAAIYKKLEKICHVDKIGPLENKKLDCLAKKTFQLLGNLRAEAKAKMNGDLGNKESQSKSRVSMQEGCRATMDADIADALAAEDEFYKKETPDPKGDPLKPDANRTESDVETHDSDEEDAAQNFFNEDAMAGIYKGYKAADQNLEGPDIVSGGDPTEPKTESEEKKPESEEDSIEKQLMDELEQARNDYANTELKEVNTIQRLRKALGVGTNEQQESPNVAAVRMAYENSLKALKDHKVNKLRESGVDGMQLKQEIKNLFTYFNYDETIKFYDSSRQARMNYLAETENKSKAKIVWDKLRLGSEKLGNWWDKKVHSSVKLGLMVASFLPGLHVLAIGKRGWGALMMATAGGMQIDRFMQRWQGRQNRKKSEEFADKVLGYEMEKGADPFELLSAELGTKINEIDEKLAKRRLTSQASKYCAFAYGMVLGANFASIMLEMAGHGADAAQAAGAGTAFAAETKQAMGGFSGGNNPSGSMQGLRETFSKEGFPPDTGTPPLSGMPNIEGMPKPDFDPNNTLHFGDVAHAAKPGVFQGGGGASEAVKEIPIKGMPHIEGMPEPNLDPGSTFHGLGANAETVHNINGADLDNVKPFSDMPKMNLDFDSHNTLHFDQHAADAAHAAQPEYGPLVSHANEVPAGGNYVEIKSGGNFWKSIESQLDKAEPGVNHKELTGKVWGKAITEYAKSHNMTYDEALKKLSRIKPGTGYTMTHDADGWHAHFNDENIHFMRKYTKKVLGKVAEHDGAKIEISNNIPTDAQGAKIEIGDAIPAGEGAKIEIGDAGTDGGDAFIGNAEGSQAVESQIEDIVNSDTPRAGDNLILHELYEKNMNFRQATEAFRKVLFSNNADVYRELKDVKMSDLLNGSGHSLDDLPNAESRRIFQQMLKEYPPKYDYLGGGEETVESWSRRVVETYSKLNQSK